MAYLYRWTQEGTTHSYNFPAGTPLEFIQAKVLEIEAGLLRNKLGIEDSYEQQQKSRLMLRELRDWYIDLAQREGLAQRTIYIRKNCMDRLIRFAGEDCLAKNITRERLNDFKRELLKTNSPAGARVALSKLQGVFKKGFYEGKLIAHPFVGFEYPRGKSAVIRPVLTPQEMLEIDDLFLSREMRLAWRIARFTGMRGNDILALKGENVDREKSMITFCSKKMSRIERIAMHAGLVKYLDDVPPSGLVFSYRYWGSLSAEFSNKIQRLKGDGFHPAGSHTPRHSLGSFLRNEANWRHEDIKLFLCHHRSDVTWLYTHDDVERLRGIVNELPFS